MQLYLRRQPREKYSQLENREDVTMLQFVPLCGADVSTLPCRRTPPFVPTPTFTPHPRKVDALSQRNDQRDDLPNTINNPRPLLSFNAASLASFIRGECTWAVKTNKQQAPPPPKKKKWWRWRGRGVRPTALI